MLKHSVGIKFGLRKRSFGSYRPLPLAEFREPEGNKIRKDRSFEKDYINGRYGAIPYIKD